MKTNFRPNYYSQPEVDYHYWCHQIKAWSLDEFVALSLDRDPALVTLNVVSPPREHLEKLYVSRYEIVSRWMEEPTPPKDFPKRHAPKKLLNFASSIGMLVPAKLIEGIEGEVKDFRALYHAALERLEQSEHSAQTIENLKQRITELKRREPKSAEGDEVLRDFLQVVQHVFDEYPSWRDEWLDAHPGRDREAASDRVLWLKNGPLADVKDIEAHARIIQQFLARKF